MPVAAPERRLIEKLVTEYKLPAEVVNVLIEFSLERTNQRLNASFVEKVAASWMRLKIDSKEKALQNIQQTNQKKEPELPDWYSITESTEPDEDLLKKALELQRKGS
jgi:replication initiation and membrane attachment protein